MFKLLRCALLTLPILLGGCVVGQGVSHVVKLIGKSGGSGEGGDGGGASPQSPPVAAARPLDRDPPPAPAAAPRDEIKVESLPPPRD